MALEVSGVWRSRSGLLPFAAAFAACFVIVAGGAGHAHAAIASASPSETAPAIAELTAGGYQVLALPPAPWSPTARRAPAGAGPAQVLRLAVVLVNFDDAPIEPFTSSEVEATLFGPSGSVAALYKEQSFGLVRLEGNAFGWLTVPRGDAPCDFSAWAASVSAAIGEGVLSGYTNLLLVFPTTAACAWSGLAYVGGTTAWLNGNPSARAAGHELGHNLGLGHASSLSCVGPEGRVPLSADCEKADEYGDPFTLMGSGGTLHVNGIHKVQLGWLGAANVLDVSTSGSYELAPLGNSSSVPQVLRIPRGDSVLVLEYRQPVGAFERFGGPLEPRGGVTARLAMGSGSLQQSLLVDTTPGTASYTDAALAVGHELVDGATGVRVRTLATTPERASVHIVVPGTVTTKTPVARAGRPTTLAAVVTPGRRRARVDLRWLPPAGDAVSHYLVLRDGRLVARTRRLAATRFDKHGRGIYSVVAVSPSGVRSAKSPRLVISTARPRRTGTLYSPIRGVTSRPMPDGRLTLGLRNRPALIRATTQRRSESVRAHESLRLRLNADRTRLLVRPADRPAARPVQVIVVRRPPLMA